MCAGSGFTTLKRNLTLIMIESSSFRYLCFLLSGESLSISLSVYFG